MVLFQVVLMVFETYPLKNPSGELLSRRCAGHMTKNLGRISMKIKNYRFPCEVCGNSLLVASVQVFFRKDGTVSCARARHFGTDKKFYYHPQSVEYVKAKLKELGIDPGHVSSSSSIEQNIPKISNNIKLELGMGIEPIYNSSAGCRLNHSATPARMHQRLALRRIKTLLTTVP